jgi:hypothetical protein
MPAFGETPSSTHVKTSENPINFPRMLLSVSGLNGGLFFHAFDRTSEKGIKTDF